MSIWAAWAPDWSLYDKVDFDGINRIVYVHPEVTALDIRQDLYTSWIDWIALRDHAKFLPTLRVTGLDPIGAGVYTGDVYFLINGWKLQVDLQKVKVTGVLFSDDFDTAYYTPELVPQYPVTVSSLVTTVSTGSSGGGSSGPTAAQIRAEIDANSVKLNQIKNTVEALPTTGQIATATTAAVWSNTTRSLTTSAGGGATLAEIEASTVLAKQATLTSIQNNINSIPDAVRTELTPELAHVLALENNPGMTPTQATMLLELFRLAGLDPSRPLIVTPTQRTAGDINQNISSSSTETIVIRT